MKACQTPYCRNEAEKGRTICGKCRSRKYRANNQMMASYMTLRDNAKRRRKVFTITFDYFREFCYKTEYIQGKGRTKGCFTIDRIREDLGYVPGNIQKLEIGANKKKHLLYEYQTKHATVVTTGQRSEGWFDE